MSIQILRLHLISVLVVPSFLGNVSYSFSVIRCPAYPHPTNAELSTDITIYGTEVTVNCDIGFLIMGVKNLTTRCQADKTWTITDHCEGQSFNISF